MASNIPARLREFVADRANHRCEYCLVHEDDSYMLHQVDHIVSRKHGGLSDPPNLAYACIRCNLWKGSDAGSIDPATNTLVPLFHPRRDKWNDHFATQGAVIEPLTDKAAATVRMLRLNHEHRLAERELLSSAGGYPRNTD